MRAIDCGQESYTSYLWFGKEYHRCLKGTRRWDEEGDAFDLCTVARVLLCHDPDYCRLQHWMRAFWGHLFNGMPVAFTHKTKKPLGPEIGVLVTSPDRMQCGWLYLWFTEARKQILHKHPLPLPPSPCQSPVTHGFFSLIRRRLWSWGRIWGVRLNHESLAFFVRREGFFFSFFPSLKQ